MAKKWFIVFAASLLFVVFPWNGSVVPAASSTEELTDSPLVFGEELSQPLLALSDMTLVFLPGPSSKAGSLFFAHTSHQGLETSFRLPAKALSTTGGGRFGKTGYQATLLSKSGRQFSLPFSAAAAIRSLRVGLPRDFQPGLYTMTIDGPDAAVSTQDFAWGVLAVNTDKDRYRLNEVADFAFGVLDERGEIVCDAAITLTLHAPDGSSRMLSTRDGTVAATGTCGRKEAGFIEPDYRATITLNQTGTYVYDVLAITRNGTWTVTGKLPVVSNAPVMIRRQAATRLWPFAPSMMSVKVHFNADFSGTISDVVPATFVVTEMKPAATFHESGSERDARLVQWNGSWRAGETVIFRYTYDAPDVSPDFFLLGPLVLQPRTGDALQELRQWQIANDAGESWLTGSFTYRKKILIDKTNVDSNLSNFPLNVKISADTDIAAHVRLGTGTGYDIRFTSSGGSVSLPYEREDFHVRAGSGSGNFWVKVPLISSSTGTILYLYYGSGSAVDGQSVSSVWDANFAGVWHLPNGATLGALDSTSNDNDGTVHVAAATACMVDGGASFNGSNSPHDYIDVGTADGSLDITGDDLTASAWAYWDGSDLHGWIVSKMGATPTGSWGLYIRYNYLNMGINTSSLCECSAAPDENTCTTGGCTPSYSCEGSHSACSTYGDESSCTTHGCTPNYADPWNCACNPPPMCACGNDSMNCACGNDTMNCWCGNDPWNCGECVCESCGDSMSCACGNDTMNCACGNDTMNCGCTDPMTCACGYQVFTYCSGTPHTDGSCQQSECVASTDGCYNTYTGCSGGQYVCSSGWGDVGSSDVSVSANAWHYVTAAYNGTNVTYYVDGVAATPIAKTGNLMTMANTAKIGWEDGWNSQWFGGKLDEIRVSNIARSAAWNKFEYYNMAPGDQELTFSAEEGTASSSSSSSAAGTSRNSFYILGGE